MTQQVRSYQAESQQIVLLGSKPEILRSVRHEETLLFQKAFFFLTTLPKPLIKTFGKGKFSESHLQIEKGTAHLHN